MQSRIKCVEKRRAVLKDAVGSAPYRIRLTAHCNIWCMCLFIQAVPILHLPLLTQQDHSASPDWRVWDTVTLPWGQLIGNGQVKTLSRHEPYKLHKHKLSPRTHMVHITLCCKATGNRRVTICLDCLRPPLKWLYITIQRNSGGKGGHNGWS